MLTGLLFEANYDDLYRGLVVLANPRTVLNSRNAPDEVGSKIIRADRLIETIRAVNAEQGRGREKQTWVTVMKTANWFLSRDCPVSADYTAKYRRGAEEVTQHDARMPTCPKCGSQMVLRTAKRGKHAGRRLYGSSQYPKCRGVINLGDEG